jgi:hypothetical protein
VSDNTTLPTRLRERSLGARGSLLGVLVAVGLGLRLLHYLRNPSVWMDEGVLLINVLGKTFGELLGPLFYAEAAPPLFLWLEKVACTVLGDSTFALRLAPLLASCAALLLLVPVARRMLPAPAVPWAVLLFACSDLLLWHSCEAKPYALDVLAAVALPAVACGTAHWPAERRLGLYALAAPAVIFLCYPGCFLYGGVLLASLAEVWRGRRLLPWLAYALLALAVGGSFLLLLAGPARAQRCAAMESCWQQEFPNWKKPWTVPLWTVVSTADLCNYCCRPTGTALFPLALLGGVALWRAGQRRMLVLLTVPVALALLASYFQAYPYGGVRVLAYGAPAVVVLLAAGLPPVWAWLAPRPRLAALVLAAVLWAPVGLTAYRVVVPWQRPDAAAAADYVLTHRRQDDGVAANSWEYSYYFRRLGASYTPIDRLKLAPGPRRLWLVVTAYEAAARAGVARAVEAQAYRVVGQQHFLFASVFLLEQTPAPRSATGP